MSNKSGVAAQIISTPKGGGALSGLGEKFTPDLQSGSGRLRVPIAAPEGRNGFHPELSLDYSSGQGNGHFGLGWQLAVPSVTRQTAKGIPRYAGEDVFVLSGAEDLVPIADGPGFRRYRPRTEGLFARIDHVTGDGENYWRVATKDGLVSTYGTPLAHRALAATTRNEAASELGDATLDPAVVCDPDDAARIFEWRLTRTVDPFGNLIVYDYERRSTRDAAPTAGELQPHHYDQLELSRIRYVDYGDPAAPSFLVEIAFDYAERPDPFSNYRAGFERRTTRRCQRIRVLTHPGGVATSVRTLHLRYADALTSVTSSADPGEPTSPPAAGATGLISPSPAAASATGPTSPKPAANAVSLLAEIQLEGHDGDASEWMPPLRLSYSTFGAALPALKTASGDLPAVSLAHPSVELADLTGNGLPDIVEISQVVRYWENLGHAQFGPPRLLEKSPLGLDLADPGVQLIDADGNGRIDLMVTTPLVSGYFPLRFDGLFDQSAFVPYDVAPSFDLEGPEVRLLDLTGDGITDALLTGTQFFCFFNHPKRGFHQTKVVPRGPLAEFPNVTFADPRVKLADMTGDGLQDIVLVDSGRVDYWPNLGHGRWGRRITMLDSPTLPPAYNAKQVLLGDVDGDGVADLLYVDNDGVTLWLNQSGNRFSAPLEVKGTPLFSDIDAVRLVDLYGNGVPALIWSRDATGFAGASLFALDFVGENGKPYLLTAIDNRIGAETHIRYAPSTAHYLADRFDPATKWQTPLPFPVQVVERVEVIDRLSSNKATSEYRYRHGYWDGHEREFRGFGRVDQRDSVRFDAYNDAGDPRFDDVETGVFSPPTETRSWFDLGPIGDAFDGWRRLDCWHEQWHSHPGNTATPREVYEPDFDELPALNGAELRDALRARRGRLLRSELYALDGSSREARPYTVTQGWHSVRVIEGASTIADGLTPLAGAVPIVFPYEIGRRTSEWERGDEPMTQFHFSWDYDAYGQARSELQIAVPRERHDNFGRVDPLDARPYLVSRTRTDYAAPTDAAVHIVNRVARVTQHQLYPDAQLGVVELLEAVRNPPAHESQRESILAQRLTFYDGEAHTGLPFGEVGRHGAATRTETLILTDALIAAAYRKDEAPRLTPPNRPLGVLRPPTPSDNGSATTGSGLDPSADAPEWPSFAPTVDTPLALRTEIDAWPDEVPLAYRDALATAGAVDPQRPGLVLCPAGYGVSRGSEVYADGYFSCSSTASDVQLGHARARGLTNEMRDPAGAVSQISHDDYALMPVAVTDPLGLTSQASADYRVLQPQAVTDPNGNRVHYAYTALGVVAATALMGKADGSEGDTLAQPSTRFSYELLAYHESGQPISVRTTKRVHHALALDVPESERDELIESVEYSDGFGRLLQTRTQAEEVIFGDPSFGDAGLSADAAIKSDCVGRVRPAEAPRRVIVSGWQRYDNKARVVEKWEPFFDSGWDYDPPSDAQLGQSVRRFFDPRGHVVRSLNPDGSEKHVIYGLPHDARPTNRAGVVFPLDSPPPWSSEAYTPTPWETTSYDENDTAGWLQLEGADAFRLHHNTPSTTRFDALGHAIETVERLRHDDETIEELVTKQSFDLRGNVLNVIDPLVHEGRPRVAFEYVYDLTPKRERKDAEGDDEDGPTALRIANIDAGVRRVVVDSRGAEIERRDSKGALTLEIYDLGGRLTHVWARNDASRPLTLRQRLIYGDAPESGLSPEIARAANLGGRLYRHYDEAGLVTSELVDFKGNMVKQLRRAIRDEVLLAHLDATPAGAAPLSWQVNWTPPAQTSESAHIASLLEPTAHRTSTTYDALGRVRALTYPEDTSGQRKRLEPHYDRAGQLERVSLDGAPYVERIAYDAKGQRTLVAYANGVMTRYRYDERTFRLTRLVSERYSAQTETSADAEQLLRYLPSGSALQNLAYHHDRVGNILEITDTTPQSGVPNTPDGADALRRRFDYDSLYRLTSATGREADTPAPAPYWDASPRTADASVVRFYQERYRYDRAGNLIELKHLANGAGFTRQLPIRGDSNRLERLQIGDLSHAQSYDPNGNLVLDGTSRHFDWDHAERLVSFRTQTDGSSPTLVACYLYDAAGERTKKLVRTNGTLRTTTYVGPHFERHTTNKLGATPIVRDELRLMDDRRRVASLRVGPPADGDTTPATKVHLGDHLDNAVLDLDAYGAVITREELTPYGETSLGGHPSKRYRFTGKERDSESGLSYHSARYYAPWAGRWTSCDPSGPVDGSNLYAYVRSRPTGLVDPSGGISHGDQWIGGPPIDYQSRLASPGMLLKLGEGFVKQAWDSLVALHEIAKMGPANGLRALATGIVRTFSSAYTDAGGGSYGVYEGLQQFNPFFQLYKFGFHTYDAAQRRDLVALGHQAFKLAFLVVQTSIAHSTATRGMRQSLQQFEILDGVRRAKAAQMAGRTHILADVHIDGRSVERRLIRINRLRSPKQVIDISAGGLQRWLRVLYGFLSDSETPPIVVRPGSRGLRMRDVKVRKGTAN